MADNIADGANHIGLYLEWCTDSVISGNTVRHCQESAITLFYACRRASITGNAIHCAAGEHRKLMQLIQIQEEFRIRDGQILRAD